MILCDLTSLFNSILETDHGGQKKYNKTHSMISLVYNSGSEHFKWIRYT